MPTGVSQPVSPQSLSPFFRSTVRELKRSAGSPWNNDNNVFHPMDKMGMPALRMAASDMEARMHHSTINARANVPKTANTIEIRYAMLET